MNSEKVSIEIDASAWLTETGVETAVYIGQGADTPTVSEHETYNELIDRGLGAYTIFEDEIIPAHFADVKRFLDGLKNAYEYAEKRAKELGYEDE
jgi:ABC-type nitrate/sulfonate/bicarbonate transport system substrate-binding protein